MDFSTALMRLWPNGDERMPHLRAGIIATAHDVLAKYKITSQLVFAHIMAQISHECGAGHDIIENLNYSAARMRQVWPSRFPTIESAAPYANNPQALANHVYNGRMGNRVGSDDGWNFRGRGASQTTGRDGYTALAKEVSFDVVGFPDYLIDPHYFFLCGVADFKNCGCLPFAEQDDVIGVTKHLNGGLIGINERKIWLDRWKVATVSIP